MRTTFTKAVREYVKGMVQNLSLQRLTDREIVLYLKEKKQIDLGRSTVTKMRNQFEKDAAIWYDELRESASKYIAIYKERLDSLLSYQKKLHELITRELTHIIENCINAKVIMNDTFRTGMLLFNLG